MARKKTNIVELKDFLDAKVDLYNRPDFITLDPVSIPHQFSRTQDIEIAGFFAATLAWGQRITIINKCKELLSMMGNTPHDFMLNHTLSDLKPFEKFKHRTFNSTDALYFIEWLSTYYKKHSSLEDAFLGTNEQILKNPGFPIEAGLINFQNTFFSLPDYPKRTIKHVSTPARKSACKRFNMYLRWMVRQDNNGVDFGIWKKISPSQLVCPCDVHVERVARKLKLISRKGMNWQTALELTTNLRKLDTDDPVKYDFALFGLGIIERY
jgi:uncharacterized protein (TIGR02757 family)